MKVLLGAAAAALLLASTAHAQTTQPTGNCAGFAPAPTLPDGASATHAQMTGGSETVDAWRQEREAKQAACQAEVTALRAQLEAMVQAYNTAAQERANVISAWNTEVEEFNARGGSGSNRRRGSVITRPDDDR